jgi:hypothetical protein
MTIVRNLNEAYDLLLRSRVRDPKRFQFGNSTFDAVPAHFSQLNAPGFNERDMVEFALLASMRVGRLISLANVNPFEKPKASPFLKFPILYLYTDDERRNFVIAGVGGEMDALRFKADNGPESQMPVVLITEHNHQLVRAADFTEELFSKLSRGLAAHGEKDGLFVDGKSFEAVRTPNNLFGQENEETLDASGPTL